VKIEALYVYPIKSCRGVAVDAARVTPRGLEHDRRWMVTDVGGTFLTMRTIPEMTLVRVALGADGLVVTRMNHEPLALPFIYTDGPRVGVEVWGDEVEAVRHEQGSLWFSRALGQRVQLVCMPDDVRRAVDPDYARDGDIVSFADGFPLLVCNAASLLALGADDMRRFRPSIVIAGAPAWAEDGWKTLSTASLTLRTPKPCARCAIPGVDPDTAATTKEPLRTLAQLRTRDHKTFFGVNAIPDGEGVLHVGDEVVAG
jgi:uncharacterized protein YcbX